MENILIAMLKATLIPALQFMDTQLKLLMNIVLFAEKYMLNSIGFNQFDKLTNMLTMFGVSLIILKFLKKGFDIYIMWTDDPDSDPMVLVTNFIKALAVCLSFPIMYQWIANVLEDMTNQLLNTIVDAGSLTWESYFQMLPLSLFSVVLLLIALIAWFVLYVQFISRGFEIFILRLGMPIACTGLIDNNKGVFAGYLQKIFQATLSVMVQVVISKMAVSLLISGNPIWSIAAIVAALSTPHMLNDVILTGGGGIGMNAVYHTAQMGKMIASAVKKAG